jgi:COP9 signalosome complex subunit 6
VYNTPDFLLFGIHTNIYIETVKDVHKSPMLDLVGWFTITPPSGPSPSQLGIHRQVLKDYNDSAVFLAFHPSQIGQDSESGAKLPLTIYESIFEGDNAVDADRAMQLDGEEQGIHIRFRELPYSIETSDAEMISVDFVARGGGNAMAIKAPSESTKITSEEEEANKKKKAKKNPRDEKEDEESAALSPEDEDRKRCPCC